MPPLVWHTVCMCHAEQKHFQSRSTLSTTARQLPECYLPSRCTSDSKQSREMTWCKPPAAAIKPWGPARHYPDHGSQEQSSSSTCCTCRCSCRHQQLQAPDRSTHESPQAHGPVMPTDFWAPHSTSTPSPHGMAGAHACGTPRLQPATTIPASCNMRNPATIASCANEWCCACNRVAPRR
jgi:hypothetical protein